MKHKVKQRRQYKRDILIQWEGEVVKYFYKLSLSLWGYAEKSLLFFPRFGAIAWQTQLSLWLTVLWLSDHVSFMMEPPCCMCPVGSVSVLICSGGPVHPFGQSPQPLRAADTDKPTDSHHRATWPFAHSETLGAGNKVGTCTSPYWHTNMRTSRTHDHGKWQWPLFTQPSHPPVVSFHPPLLVCHVVCHFPQMSVPPWDSD